MHLLLACLFNSVWLFGSFAFSWLLFRLSAFVPLPIWLKTSIILALSFWVGLLAMMLFADRMTGESWKESREKARMFLVVGVPTGATCFLAVVFYLLVNKWVHDAATTQTIVSTVAIIFWFTAMSLGNKQLEAQFLKATAKREINHED